MIRYLIDSSALWRLLRDDSLRAAWSNVITAGAVGSCYPQRIEFRRSARDLDEFEEMTEMFDTVYPDVPVPKSGWQWVEAGQFRLGRGGAHRAISTVDLLICATAAHGGLVILHDDNDLVTAAGHLTDLRQRRVRDAPDNSA